MIYTSGSTGNQKVLIEHNGVVNLAWRNALRLTYGTKFLQFASFGLMPPAEVFNTLLSGGVLVTEKEDLLSAESFGQWLKIRLRS
ncbi:hypothetical protein CS542_09180 [Pedobacter sp. IW39]|nr:hypothetical protein CS542_09180 [Pedobacter sp. IW39]